MTSFASGPSMGRTRETSMSNQSHESRQSHDRYLTRMSAYLRVMFPVGIRAFTAVALYLGFAAYMKLIHGVRTPVLSWHTLLGIWSIFAILLILRLMDELKDLDIDRELFPHRPVPSGLVRLSDIRVTLAGTIVLYVLANASSGTTLWPALATVAYALLMFRYFFMPGILREHLPLNLATHNPIIAFVFLHASAVFAAEQDLGLRQLEWPASALLILMFWGPLFSWEIARKIRAPEEETAYVTYSQLWGRTGSVAVILAAQAGALALGLILSVQFSFPRAWLALGTVGFASAAWAALRYLRRPSGRTSQLAPFAEGYAMALCVAGLVAYGLAGLSLGAP